MSKRFIYFLLAIVFLCGGVWGEEGGEGREYLKNGDFEKKLEGWVWQVYGGAKATCRVERVGGGGGGGEGGGYALVLSSESDAAPGVGGVLSQTAVGLKPNTEYKLTAKFKGQQIGPAWILGGPTWDVRGYFWLGDFTDWQEISILFRTGENQTAYDVMVTVDGKTGALWVDDIRIVDASEEKMNQAEKRLRLQMEEAQKALGQMVQQSFVGNELKFRLQDSQKKLQEFVQARREAEKRQAAMPPAQQAQWVTALDLARVRIDGVILWTQAAMQEIRPTSLPKKYEDIEKIRWRACINEHAPAVVNITNLAGGPAMDFRVVLSPFMPSVEQGRSVLAHRLGDWSPAETGSLQAYRGGAEAWGEIPSSQVILRQALPIRKATGDWTGDPLPKLGEAHFLSVPMGQTRQLWIDVMTEGLKPGVYSADLTVVPADPMRNQMPRVVRLELEVLPLALPKRMPIAAFGFDYGLSANPKCAEDLMAHGINSFHIRTPQTIPTAPTKTDFRFLDVYIANAKKCDGVLLLENPGVPSTGWKEAYTPWFAMMFAYLRESGLRDDQFVMHLYDETLSDTFLEAAKAIKKIDEKVMIFADPYQTHYTEEVYRDFMPYIDIWCPKVGLLEDWIKAKPAVMEMIRSQKKQLWIYDCNSGKSIESANSNRTFGWCVFKYGAQGFGAWTYSTTDYGDPWQMNSSWEKVYPMADGSPVPSRRWEAWREGLEDYCLLDALRTMIREKKNAGVSAADYQRYQERMDQVVAAVLGNTQDPQLLENQRERLLDMVNELTTAIRQ